MQERRHIVGSVNHKREFGVASNLARCPINAEFANIVESLELKFAKLIAMNPVRYSSLPREMPERGIYLFSQGKRHLYVGRTNRLRRRLAGHCRPSSSHFSATFAFRMARKRSGFTKASYSRAGSRPELVTHATFGPLFLKAKAQIAKMDIRFVEEKDPIRQALLEIYVAVSLGLTRYNDFDNH
jgi:predicted GIY-YIG superfamily endonuclease